MVRQWPGEAEGPRGAGRAALGAGAARGGNAAAPELRNPPAPAERREVSHLAVKHSKTGTEREISASVSLPCLLQEIHLLFSSQLFQHNLQRRPYRTDFLLLYICVCVYIHYYYYYYRLCLAA